MSEDFLQKVQTLQFTDKAQAEALLLAFVRESLPPKAANFLTRPLAVSINSFNGFMTLDDGKRLFFKTNTEPDSVIGEYDNAAMLAEAGYPVISRFLARRKRVSSFSFTKSLITHPFSTLPGRLKTVRVMSLRHFHGGAASSGRPITDDLSAYTGATIG